MLLTWWLLLLLLILMVTRAQISIISYVKCGNDVFKRARGGQQHGWHCHHCSCGSFGHRSGHLFGEGSGRNISTFIAQMGRFDAEMIAIVVFDFFGFFFLFIIIMIIVIIIISSSSSMIMPSIVRSRSVMLPLFTTALAYQ